MKADQPDLLSRIERYQCDVCCRPSCGKRKSLSCIRLPVSSSSFEHRITFDSAKDQVNGFVLPTNDFRASVLDSCRLTERGRSCPPCIVLDVDLSITYNLWKT